MLTFFYTVSLLKALIRSRSFMEKSFKCVKNKIVSSAARMVQVLPFSFAAFTCSGLGICTRLGASSCLVPTDVDAKSLMCGLSNVHSILFHLGFENEGILNFVKGFFSKFIKIIMCEFIQDSTCGLYCVC